MGKIATPRIRKFNAKDLKEILEIEKNAFPKTSYPEEVFERYARNPDAIFVVAEIEGAIAGYLIMEKEGHIVSTAVGSCYRRKGIGKRLFHHAARTAGKKPWLEVRSKNTGAISFYRKIGMKTMGVYKNYYGDDDALVMVMEGEGNCESPRQDPVCSKDENRI